MQNPTNRVRELEKQAAELVIQWKIFSQLFRNPVYDDIFEKSGSTFWLCIRAYLIDSIFSSISRFMDPPTSCGNSNLSLKAAIEWDETKPLNEDLTKRLSSLEKNWSKGIKKWRHKRISHADLDTIVCGTGLPVIEFQNIDALVAEISAFSILILDQIYGEKKNHDIVIHWGVDQVVNYLKLGIAKKDEELKKIQSEDD